MELFFQAFIPLFVAIGAKAIAKVAALFLAGIAVMMIRSGIQGMIRMME